MVSREDIVRQAERCYPAYLRSLVNGEIIFPLAVTLGKSRRSRDYEDRQAELGEVRRAAAALGLEVDWHLVADPRFGPHERPRAACFADEATYLAAIGKTREVARFRFDLATLLEAFPVLRDWAGDHVKILVAQYGEWPRIVRVLGWLLRNPASGLYLRQLPISGGDTKFIERQLALLDRLLIALDPGRIEPAGTPFLRRHGLREEESLIRLRFLDPLLRIHCGMPETAIDLSVPLSAAAALSLAGSRVFITENLRNFLALPDHPGGIALFGHGDAASRLGGLVWLRRCEIFYWGDIDARGFAILARLREPFPHVQSLLMDAATLRQYRDLAGSDPGTGTSVATGQLTEQERDCYREAVGAGLRLEQERIPMDRIDEILDSLSRRG